MKTISDIVKLIRKNRKELEATYNLKKIGIFGSYVRGKQKKDSDVDILVEVKRPMGFVKFIGLENYLSKLLGIKVDLVTKKALKPYIGQRILREVRYV
ncbi:MAG TPA: nucleotidyltransferase [Candidatus Omnitrophica bacterium]|nr:MAG: nucleotidyltransferase [Omnitrophica WOR_2 bacterium GWA2_53_43]HBO97050.1 nucleotidyltransferase [Candidatus Omnitrophota bacterium]HCI45439.1 nucleotidyltransferase [Candidatus Omnitrophota bacterium]